MSWFERFLPVIERLPTDRLALMRDIIGAMVERRRAGEVVVTHDDLQSALLHACGGHEPQA